MLYYSPKINHYILFFLKKDPMLPQKLYFPSPANLRGFSFAKLEKFFHSSGKRAHYSIDGRCNCFDQARPVEPAHLPSTLSAFLLLPTISVAHAARRGIDRLRLYGISCLFSRALRARGSLCKGIKKNFRRRPAKTPLPLISDCPGGVVLPLPRQHSALLLFLMPGIAQTRLMCLAALAFQCRVVNVVFHLARTADKTTVFLAEPQRQGRKPHTITL